jgi:SNF2 family DNA or RNA helicase
MDKLHIFQKEIVDECINKGSGGLSLPMGCGKTFISLIVALKQVNDENGEILIIVAKNLISTWESEISKFFGESLSYKVYINSNKDKECNFEDYKIILTTPETVSSFYTSNEIEEKFIWIDQRPDIRGVPINYNLYVEPKNPFLNFDTKLKRGDLFFSKRWKCLIVDEGHNYFNITTLRSKALCSICATHRWVLSGTLFDEPKPERILGYFLMINYDKYPRNLPDIEILVKSSKFDGLMETLVYRKTNEMIDESNIIINKKVISHTLSKNEGEIYLMLKVVLNKIQKEVKKYKFMKNTLQLRKFSSYILVMITLTRTFLVCPLITIASIYLDTIDYDNKSELTKILYEELNKRNLYEWLNDEKNIISSRMQEIIKVVDLHSSDRIVIFSSFRTTINVLKNCITNRPVLEIIPSQSPAKRGKVLEDFANTKNGVLLLTYNLGSDGLNLQCANTVLIADYWWNSGKTKQSVARVNRYGQLAKEIFVYYFTSNTGIEKALFAKHHDKLKIENELLYGQQFSSIKKIRTDDILRLINNDEYMSDFNNTYNL